MISAGAASILDPILMEVNAATDVLNGRRNQLTSKF